MYWQYISLKITHYYLLREIERFVVLAKDNVTSCFADMWLTQSVNKEFETYHGTQKKNRREGIIFKK